MTQATETTFVHFRHHNAPLGTWGSPPERAFSSSDKGKALLCSLGLKGISSDCANASHIREEQQNKDDKNENCWFRILASFYMYAVNRLE